METEVQTKADAVKSKGFICFLLGMFFGRYAVPLVVHGVYVAIIIALAVKAFVVR